VFNDSPGQGTWYYRLAIYNSNDLVSYSETASAVIQ
jgi:hypothetical protein